MEVSVWLGRGQPTVVQVLNVYGDWVLEIVEGVLPEPVLNTKVLSSQSGSAIVAELRRRPLVERPRLTESSTWSRYTANSEKRSTRGRGSNDAHGACFFELLGGSSRPRVAPHEVVCALPLTLV